MFPAVGAEKWMGEQQAEDVEYQASSQVKYSILLESRMPDAETISKDFLLGIVSMRMAYNSDPDHGTGTLWEIFLGGASYDVGSIRP